MKRPCCTVKPCNGSAFHFPYEVHVDIEVQQFHENVGDSDCIWHHHVDCGICKNEQIQEEYGTYNRRRNYKIR